MPFTITPTPLDGVLIIESEVFRDERGFFLESYRESRYIEHGIRCRFVQDNHSRSALGILRGLHYQNRTAPQAKLVRCTHGHIVDVAVDLRVGSPTLGRWVAVDLSADNFRQVLIPSGFAHGFAVLSEFADVQYKCSEYYAPDAERAIRWDDPDLAIDWPIQNPIISSRDQAGMSFKDYLARPDFFWT